MKYALIIVAALLVAGGIYIQSTSDQNLLSGQKGSSDQSTAQKIEFEDLGPAPEFTGISNWLNSEALTMQELRGKVVLIDFWTYSCINCIRTLPYITKWYDTYKDDGLVVVGVHTPEFAFEKDAGNVQTAINRHNIHYPVAQDNDYRTWRAFNNRYWPAKYLIDQEGTIVYTHFGEGKYDVTEAAIRQLLGLNEPASAVEFDDPQQRRIGTPEIYFGLSRLDYLGNTQEPTTEPKMYEFPQLLSNNHFALQGEWQFNNERAMLVSAPGRVKLDFYAAAVHMVAQADQPVRANVFVDGQRVGEVTIHESQLYTLFDSTEYDGRILELEILDPGLEAFTFTFG